MSENYLWGLLAAWTTFWLGAIGDCLIAHIF